MKVHFSTHLAPYTKGALEIEESGATLSELLVRLDERFPGIRFRIVDEQDRIRPHILFFVGGELARSLGHSIGPNDDVHILAALSGG
jgi:molybdopterin converting factor small subunit